MIHFFIGTKAQLIKLAPVLMVLERLETPYRYIDAGQHGVLSENLRARLGIRHPDISLHSRLEDISTARRAIHWYLRLVYRAFTQRRWLNEEVFPGGGVCLIHGDTLSTLLGLQLARRAGLQVAHVEAGLRSFRLWDPFPEELIRSYCMRKSHILFAPTNEAVANLQALRVAGEIIPTGGNTSLDSVKLLATSNPSISLPTRKYAVATCHRWETISSRRRLNKVIHLLNEVAAHYPVMFVIHAPTRNFLRKYALDQQLRDDVTLLPLQEYPDFLSLLRSAAVVLTDGGSIQEECAYLNKPCLILRRSTERSDGIDSTATLWRFDPEIAHGFINQAQKQRAELHRPTSSPSEEIVRHLQSIGYA